MDSDDDVYGFGSSVAGDIERMSNRVPHLPEYDDSQDDEDYGEGHEEVVTTQLTPLDNQRTLGFVDDCDSDTSSGHKPKKSKKNAPSPKQSKTSENTFSWEYVSIDGIVEKYGYDSSCDELEDDDEEEWSEPEEVESDEESPWKIPFQDRVTNFHKNVMDMPTVDDIERERKIKRRKKDLKDDASKCFGCLWYNDKSDAISGRCMNRLLSIIEENYGQIANEALSRVAHLYFKHNIYLPMKKLGKSVPLWRSRHIQQHIEEHSREPRFFIGQSMSLYSNIMKKLQNMIFRNITDPGGASKVVFDEKTLKMHLDLHKRVTELYRIKPNGMNFYNEKLKVDFERIGNFVNLSKEWTTN